MKPALMRLCNHSEIRFKTSAKSFASFVALVVYLCIIPGLSPEFRGIMFTNNNNLFDLVKLIHGKGCEQILRAEVLGCFPAQFQWIIH